MIEGLLKRKKKKKQPTRFAQIKQASESEMARVLELSDQEPKTAKINLLNALLNKMDNMQEHMSSVNRDGNPKKESNRNARNQKRYNRNEEFF